MFQFRASFLSPKSSVRLRVFFSYLPFEGDGRFVQTLSFHCHVVLRVGGKRLCYIIILVHKLQACKRKEKKMCIMKLSNIS